MSPLLHVLPMGPGYDPRQAEGFHGSRCRAAAPSTSAGPRRPHPSKILPCKQTQQEARGNVGIYRSGARVAGISGGDGDGAPLSVHGRAGGRTRSTPTPGPGRGVRRPQRDSRTWPALGDLPSCARWSELRGVTCVAVRPLPRAGGASATDGLCAHGPHDATLLPAAVAQAMAASRRRRRQEAAGARGDRLLHLRPPEDARRVRVGRRRRAQPVDFYRADQIAEIEDDAEVVSPLSAPPSPPSSARKRADASAVVDSAVVRARGAR